MPFTGIVETSQLAVAKQALEDHCQEFGIQKGTLEYEMVGRHTISLLSSGLETLEELKRGLCALDRPCKPKQ